MGKCARCGKYGEGEGLCPACKSVVDGQYRADQKSEQRQKDRDKRESAERAENERRERLDLLRVYNLWYEKLTPEEQAQAKLDYGSETGMLSKARKILWEDEQWAIKQDRIEREEKYNKPENVIKRQKKEKWEKSFMRRFLSNTWDVVKWLIIIGVIVFVFKWLFPGTFNNIVNWITDLLGIGK